MKKNVLVVAHPDDEVLWFSSIINEVDKIIFVFFDTKNEEVFKGRKSIIQNKDLPYSNKIVNLNIKEADVLNRSNWKMPIPREYGIENSSSNYKKNYEEICNLLNKEILGFNKIYTHNPWGDYGHEEHVQVFKAILKIYNSSSQQIWVSCYFSDRSYRLMNFYRNIISDINHFKEIDHNFCKSIKDIYMKKMAWTWDENYKWPLNEFFYNLDLTKNILEKNNKPPTNWPPMNFILMSTIFTSNYSKIRSLLIQILQMFLPKFIFNLLLNKYRAK